MIRYQCLFLMMFCCLFSGFIGFGVFLGGYLILTRLLKQILVEIRVIFSW